MVGVVVGGFNRPALGVVGVVVDDAVAVEVVAEGVQLSQGGDGDEAVLVLVVGDGAGGEGNVVGLGLSVLGGDEDGDGVAADVEDDLVAGGISFDVVGGSGLVGGGDADDGTDGGGCRSGGDGDDAVAGGDSGVVGGGSGGEGFGEGSGGDGQGGKGGIGGDGGLAGELGAGAVSAVFEGGVLGSGAEVPGVVESAGVAGGAGGGIVVHIHIPVGVDAGGGGGAAVGGGAAQLVGFQAQGIGQVAALGASGADSIPVAVGDGAGRAKVAAAHAHQSADGGDDRLAVQDGVALADHGAAGVAGGNGAAVASGQAADGVDIIGRHQPGGLSGGGDGCGSVAGGNSAGVLPDQPADPSVAGDPAALDIAGQDAAGEGAASDAAHPFIPAHLGVDQAEGGYGAGQPADQPDVGVNTGGGLDEQIGDDVAVAVEYGGERHRGVVNHVVHAAGEGRPAGAAVPVEVGGVHFAAVVGVEVQVIEEFVAGAGGDIGGVAVAVVVGEGAAHTG